MTDSTITQSAAPTDPDLVAYGQQQFNAGREFEAERLAALSATPQAPAEPTLCQYRARPGWVTPEQWHPWDDCSSAEAADYERTPLRHDWHYEVRRLYATPPAQEVQAGPMDAESWAELHRLRHEIKGPDGYATWKEAATAELIRRVAAEQASQEVQASQAVPSNAEMVAAAYRLTGSPQGTPPAVGFNIGARWMRDRLATPAAQPAPDDWREPHPPHRQCICPYCIPSFDDRFTPPAAQPVAQADQWLPIETAPKTSKARLVWCPDMKNIFVVCWDGEGWSHFGGKCDRLWDHPTHWMPLPTPPAAQTRPELTGDTTR